MVEHGPPEDRFIRPRRRPADGRLVVPLVVAATLQVLVPRSLLLAVADHPVLSPLALGRLAVVLAIRSVPTG